MKARGNDGVPRPHGVLDVALLESVGRLDPEPVIVVGIDALDRLVVGGQRPAEGFLAVVVGGRCSAPDQPAILARDRVGHLEVAHDRALRRSGEMLRGPEQENFAGSPPRALESWDRVLGADGNRHHEQHCCDCHQAFHLVLLFRLRRRIVAPTVQRHRAYAAIHDVSECLCQSCTGAGEETACYRHEGGWCKRAQRAATFSPTQPMIRSAISRLFLSIISMWLLALGPASGSSRNLAEPPADLMALTVAAQPLRRSSPFGPGAPWLLSPHTDSSGTLEKIFTTSSGVAGAQLPSILMKPSILTARARTRSMP